MEQTIFDFFDKESIFINRKEFSFQLNSHPDFPSLLSIVDTFNFFKIKTGTVKVVWDKFHLLPFRFLCYVKNSHGELELAMVERSEKGILKDGKPISQDALRQIWSDIVVLSEQSGDLKFLRPKKRNRVATFSGITMLIILGIYFTIATLDLFSMFFLCLSSAGILFSLRSHQDLFKWENKITKKICNPSKSECGTVFKSTKWKLLEKINLSDIALVFFFSQSVSFLISMGVDRFYDYYLLQNYLLILSLPVVILSLYYQKMVEKKWCRVCLGISAILTIQLVSLSFFGVKQFSFDIRSSSILMLGFIFSTLTFFWVNLKDLLLKYRSLQESEIKASAFKRKYKLFKNSLVASTPRDLPEPNILIGNPASKVRISLVTNLHCSFCKTAHFVLEGILRDFPDVQMNIIFNVNKRNMTKDSERLYHTLLQKYNRSKNEFQESLSDWFYDMDINRWLEENKENTQNGENQYILDSDYEWCINNNLNFTPVLIVNDYIFPEFYEVSDLPYFMNELTHDSSFINK